MQRTLRSYLRFKRTHLKGLEKAERNVLPVLNNLLENREMALDDGRMLVSARRYDEASTEQRQHSLVCVDDRFMVVALTVPVPRYSVGSCIFY